MLTNNKIDALKLQHQTLLAEYQVMRQSIYAYRSMQGQLDNITLAALGVSIPVILTILDRSLQYMGVILLIPILFFAVAFTQLRHERMITITAIYIDKHLRSDIEQILSKMSKENLPVLRWERFLSLDSWTEGLLWKWLATCLRSILGFGAGVGIMGVYVFIRFSQLQGMLSFEIWLLAVNGILLVIDLVVALDVARQRQAHDRENYYEKK